LGGNGAHGKTMAEGFDLLKCTKVIQRDTSSVRCNLMQAVENLCSRYRLSLSRVKACEAMCNFCFPSRFRAWLWIGFYANEEAVCEGDALVGRQDQGVLRERIECRRHGIRYDRKRNASTQITAREHLSPSPDHCR
jgi:hypothetical protein